MNLRISFSLTGLIIFILPMIVNIAYVMFPPENSGYNSPKPARWLEITEKTSRIAYMISVTFLKNAEPVNMRSLILGLACVFLVLYYIVWLRYFINGRDTVFLGKPFLAVPLPLAVFPVLYFLSAALWLRNFPAIIFMIIFGASHIAITAHSFY